MKSLWKIGLGVVAATVGSGIMHLHFSAPYFDPWEATVFVSYALTGAFVWSAA